MAVKTQRLFIPGPAGQQELFVNTAEKSRAITAVICHPHPVHGGTLHNKVVYTLASVLETLHIKTVRFNFRGVQKSAGQFDHGVGELQDLLSVVHWVKKTYPEDDIWLAGFSFGGFVAIKGNQLCQAKQLITVAPPVGQPYFSNMPTVTCPWIVVQGGQDEIISADEVMSWTKEQQPAPEIIFMPDAGHFFHGKLIAMKNDLLLRLKKRIYCKLKI